MLERLLALFDKNWPHCEECGRPMKKSKVDATEDGKPKSFWYWRCSILAHGPGKAEAGWRGGVKEAINGGQAR